MCQVKRFSFTVQIFLKNSCLLVLEASLDSSNFLVSVSRCLTSKISEHQLLSTVGRMGQVSAFRSVRWETEPQLPRLVVTHLNNLTKASVACTFIRSLDLYDRNSVWNGCGFAGDHSGMRGQLYVSEPRSSNTLLRKTQKTELTNPAPRPQVHSFRGPGVEKASRSDM